MDNEILIVEDESRIARFISLELEHEGYKTKSIISGREGLEEALKKDYDLVILDVMLPDLNGIEVLRRLRQVKSTPVIILTARDQVMDKVAGLDLGASDYMTKPFAIEELLARIRANIKKHVGIRASELVFGRLRVDTEARKATYGDEPVDLSKKEFDLLVYLLENRNIVISREKMLDGVWGFEFFGNTNVVDVYIRYLRVKIDEKYGINMIETVRGAGYIIRE
ncbi:MAG: response regulator transcription factor [Firmicutes bacterium]|nr:response regulator transcription factor [Bacillota bacterium]